MADSLSEPAFGELIQRVRAGDQDAAARLLARYEQSMRAVLRAKLTDPCLRRLVDSDDICQQVWASFFPRAADGQYDLARAENLVNLLCTMAKHKLARVCEHERAARRDCRRREETSRKEHELPDPTPDPSEVATRRDLLNTIRQRLPEPYPRVFELWLSQWTWPEIAAELGGQPDTWRIGFARALKRVLRELG